MQDLLKKKNIIKVKNFLKDFDKDIKLIVLEETARTAEDAAKSLNRKVGAIVKSIIFKDLKENEYYLCLISGDKFASIKKISELFNLEIIKANANECKEFSGFSIGGISPIAHKNKPKKILIDENLNRYSEVYAAAGHPHVVFGINFKKLCLITNGYVSNIVE